MTFLLKRYLAAAKKAVDYLLRPSTQLHDEEERYQAHLLSGLSLTLLLTLCLVAPLWILLQPDFRAAPPISLGLLLGLALSYGLSRTRHYAAGAASLSLSLFAGLVAILFASPGEPAEYTSVFAFLVVAATVAYLFLSRYIKPSILQKSELKKTNHGA